VALTKVTVAIYPNHGAAEAAVRELQKSGFDLKKLSIIGKDCHTGDHPVGYYTTGDRMKYWGELGAFWGSLGSVRWCSLLFCSRNWSRSRCWLSRILDYRRSGGSLPQLLISFPNLFN
jgi:hypothetical protein